MVVGLKWKIASGGGSYVAKRSGVARDNGGGCRVVRSLEWWLYCKVVCVCVCVCVERWQLTRINSVPASSRP